MALTVRQQGSAALGTLTRPLELPLDLSRVDPPPVLRRLTLGYANAPATAVYGITAPRRISLRVDRRSDDRLAVHVEVALLEAASRRRVAALVERADGTGTELTIEAGRYLLVASLLIPEQVELELRVQAAPVKTPLLGVGAGSGGGVAKPLGHGALAGMASGGGPAVALMRRPLLRGHGDGDGTGSLVAAGLGAISGRLRGAGGGTWAAAAAAAPFQWIDQRGRATGPLITINPANWERRPVRGIADGLQLRLRDGAGQPLNLSGLEAVLEVWDWRRLILHATYAASIDAGAGLVQLRLDRQAVNTLPEESCWDLRLRHGATGRVVYLLQGGLAPLERYGTAPEISLLQEALGFLMAENNTYLNLE